MYQQPLGLPATHPLVKAGCLALFVMTAFLLLLPKPHLLPSFRMKVNQSEMNVPEQNIHIPKSIWQVFFKHSPYEPLHENVGTWVTENPLAEYTLLDDEEAAVFVRKHYHDRPEIMDTYLGLNHYILKADLLRYMIIESEGGYYSDIDTTPKKPIHQWIPTEFENRTKAVIGIEYDMLKEGQAWAEFSLPFTFCQWTMAATRHHPLFRSVVEDVVDRISEYAYRRNTTLEHLKVEIDDVLQVTGPEIWTNAVFRTLSQNVGQPVTHLNITGLERPTLYGDVLLMPIDSFGSGQLHSGASRDQNCPGALVAHQFGSFWKKEHQR